jgi:hypothetical protein
MPVCVNARAGLSTACVNTQPQTSMLHIDADGRLPKCILRLLGQMRLEYSYDTLVRTETLDFQLCYCYLQNSTRFKITLQHMKGIKTNRTGIYCYQGV